MVKKTKQTKETREVIYPSPKMQLCIGAKALVTKQAQKLLGWQALEDDDDETEYLFKDNEGKKIRCCNNFDNRPFDLKWSKVLAQEILRKRWQFNFENVIIGKFGQVSDGQHRLIALVLATQLWNESPEDYPEWETEPTIEVSIGIGISEENEVVNTLNTGKPRSLSDVLYRGSWFQDLSPRQRKLASVMASNAVRYVWDRTGVDDAFSIHRTHAESVDFIERHPTLMKCVSHIYVENLDKSLSPFMSPGYASGLMYLMASSGSDPAIYQDQNEPNESIMDFSFMDQAEKFWTMLSSGADTFSILKKALEKLVESENLVGSLAKYKQAMLIKAWLYFVSHGKLVASACKLKLKKDSVEGWQYLDDFPTCGGIDFDSHRESGALVETGVEAEVEVEAAPEPAPKRKSRSRRSKTKLAVGNVVKVQDDDSPWQGVIMSLDPIMVQPNEGYSGSGQEFEVDEALIFVI